MIILIFFIAIWYLSLFMQTFFHHRYAAHGMFTMNRTWEKIFYVFSWLFQGSSYLSPHAYGILHRQHHAYADTDKDPHSPRFSSNVFAMMWKTKKRFLDIEEGKAAVESRFTKNLPYWKGMERFAASWGSRVAWVAVYTTFFILFASHWWLFFLLPVIIVMSPVHGAIINWFAHKLGYTNFKVKDTSKNFLPVDFLMLGESYHNNHHKFGGRANFGKKWYEIDPVYWVIRVFHFLHIVKLKKNNDLNYM